MLFYDCCKKVCENGFMLIRPSEDNPVDLETRVYENDYETRGWVLLDAVTSNLVVQVYAALTEQTREKLNKLPYPKIVDICWSAVKKEPSGPKG